MGPVARSWTMRRSARHGTAGASSFPAPFHTCVNAIDSYCQQLTLKPFVLPVPLKAGVQDADLEGLAIRLRRNRSYVKTDQNPDPDVFPTDSEPFLQRVDVTNGESRIENIVTSIRGYHADPRPGVLVLLLQPPLTTPPLPHKDAESAKPTPSGLEALEYSRPLAGVLIRIGAPRSTETFNADDDEEDDDGTRSPTVAVSEGVDRYERSIVAAFCRRSVPEGVAGELLRIALVRAIVESLCFEDVTSRSLYGNARQSDASGVIERDKRFVSINTADMTLCPTAFLPCIVNDLKFMRHWDREIGPNEFVHDENHKECPCMKKFRNANTPDPPPEYYQFFTLNAKRVKGLIEQSLSKLVPDVPSDTTLTFCLRGEAVSILLTTFSMCVLEYQRPHGKRAGVHEEHVPRKKRLTV